MNVIVEENVPLRQFCTIGLGGPARYFIRARSADHVREAHAFAAREKLPIFVLAGGSNTVFADEGFPGLVLHLSLFGIQEEDLGQKVRLTIGAGEPLDPLVERTISRGWSGLECLSGIPGSVGATPIQNVGAYGRETSDVLESVLCLDHATGNEIRFKADECSFAYRMSRFKGADRGRYIVLSVVLVLEKKNTARVRYEELARELGASMETEFPTGLIRETVLSLRRRKAMVVDTRDPDSRSVGSFFMNPVVSPAVFSALEKSYLAEHPGERVPSFRAGSDVKIPAAWLVEKSGFARGTRHGGAGISAKHSLALVNYGGTTRDLVELSQKIQQGVKERFGIDLEREAVFAGFA